MDTIENGALLVVLVSWLCLYYKRLVTIQFDFGDSHAGIALCPQVDTGEEWSAFGGEIAAVSSVQLGCFSRVSLILTSDWPINPLDRNNRAFGCINVTIIFQAHIQVLGQ